MAETPAEMPLPTVPGAIISGGAATTLPEALRPPTRRLSPGFVFILTLANVALWFSMQPIGPYLLTRQVNGLIHDSGQQTFYYGLILSFGAYLSIFTNAIGGALSDRTTSRFGRRVPWLIGGSVLAAGALALLANATGLAMLFIGYGLYQFVVNVALAALVAVVPDKVPEAQRGAVSAFVGIALPLAIVLGAVVIGLGVTDVKLGYYILAATLVVVMVIFTLFLHDARLPREAAPPFRLGAFLKGFWINPRVYPDFGLAWITRFLVNLGYSMTVGALLVYYLKDAVGVARPQQTAAVINIVAVAMIVLASVVSGFLSDRLGRRKIFVMGSSALIAVALVILALFPTMTAVYVAAVVVGLGFGAYLAVDLALLTEVLPSAGARGKDMGVFNISQALSSALGPAIGGALYAVLHSFTPTFIIAAVVVFLAAALVQPIKSVR